jgi:hypothetical protein
LFEHRHQPFCANTFLGGDPDAFLRLKVAYETVLKKKKRAAARVAKDEAKKRAHLDAKQAARAQVVVLVVQPL